ncbi:MAG: hypothetical protein HON53_05830 [Planctomycetaceae bacterium]|jgi:hypothetical protein|nr:hypothetical protein [Planctomycetaceae bacterium]MBT6157403.1 hypothetical protein [Planctomycetaceae bacterium]MBT6486882.1 hypothetical protein [Planctomycetaceae bacterium]MBT6494789.1 hypothetical protein [Planctomycetaceae bacterium]
MKFKPAFYLIAAAVCGVISLMILNDGFFARSPASAGAAGGFAASVGLLGIAAALADRNE